MPIATIRSARDAELLLRPRGFAGGVTLAVVIPGVSREQALQWEVELSTHLRECGCSLGGIFMLAALAASVAWQLMHVTPAPADWLWFAARTVALGLVAGGAGKLIGVARARAAGAAVVRSMRALESQSA